MGLLDWLKPAAAPDAASRALVEKAVVAVDPLLRTVHGYEARLTPVVSSAFAYCSSVADRIPGPVQISRHAFASDPLVHALFASADDIDDMLARSQCVREHLVGAAAPMDGACCALLGMRHREKSGFGVQLAGDMVRFDSPQRSLYFSDHTLAEPAPDVAAARRRLADAMFDSLLASIAAHVADVRAERDTLAQEQAMAAAQRRAGADPVVATRRLAELEARLHASRDALLPGKLIDTLIDSLSRPEPFLHLDTVTLTIDRAGTIVGGPASPGAETLQFVELTSRDKRRWVVMLALIERETACRAMERFDAARRYIVI